VKICGGAKNDVPKFVRYMQVPCYCTVNRTGSFRLDPAFRPINRLTVNNPNQHMRKAKVTYRQSYCNYTKMC